MSNLSQFWLGVFMLVGMLPVVPLWVSFFMFCSIMYQYSKIPAPRGRRYR